eukprot:symbB.v1.2.001116.t1/scaffold46.1/size430244/7
MYSQASTVQRHRALRSSPWRQALLLLRTLLEERLRDASQRWQLAVSLMLHAGHLTVESNIVSYNASITTTKGTLAPSWWRAMVFLQRMRHLSMRLRSSSSNAAINILGKSAEWQRCIVLLQDEAPVGSAGLGAALAALATAKRWHQASAALESFSVGAPNLWMLGSTIGSKSSHLSSSVRTSPKVLSTCEKAGAWTEVISYNSSISACVHCIQWQPSLQLLRILNSQSLESSVITVNASTTACEKAGQWQEALHLLWNANSVSCADPVTFAACIACDALRWWWTLRLLKEAQTRLGAGETGTNGPLPGSEGVRMGTLVSCNSTVSACVQSLQWHLALRLFETPHGVDLITWLWQHAVEGGGDAFLDALAQRSMAVAFSMKPVGLARTV